MNRFIVGLVLMAISVGCTSHIATNMASERLEFYNDGCDGYLFEARVQAESAILSRTTADGTDAGSLVFNTIGGNQYEFDPSKSSSIIADNQPAALATYKKNQICFHFTMEDTTDDACFASLIKTGAICTALKPDAE